MFIIDMFSVVNVYLDHLKFCVVCINGCRYVCCGECYVVSNECDEPTSFLVQPIVMHCCEVMYFGRFEFSGELGFLNCDDICIILLLVPFMKQKLITLCIIEPFTVFFLSCRYTNPIHCLTHSFATSL